MKMLPIAGLIVAAALLTTGPLRAEDPKPEPEESAILPSAEGHLDSEAGTMMLDCQKSPDDCARPLDPADAADRVEDAEEILPDPDSATTPAPAPRP